MFICEVKSIVFYVVASFQKLSLTLSHFKAQHIITCYYDVVTPVHIFTGNGGICSAHSTLQHKERQQRAFYDCEDIFSAFIFQPSSPLLPSFSKRFQLGFSLHTLTFLLCRACVLYIGFYDCENVLLTSCLP